METTSVQVEANDKNEINWKTVGYAFLAVLMAGGLIPFWLYVWFTIRPLLGAS
jgi:hypothetical protein